METIDFYLFQVSTSYTLKDGIIKIANPKNTQDAIINEINKLLNTKNELTFPVFIFPELSIPSNQISHKCF